MIKDHLNLGDLSLDELNDAIFSLGEFEKRPVDIETFLKDKYYLGGYFQDGLFPYWFDFLKKVYPSPFYSPFSIISLRGSIGVGKTTVACVGILYDLHKLLCMHSPQSYAGLVESEKIIFMLFNITKALAESVTWDKLSQMMQFSPYFSSFFDIFKKRKREETLFPKRIDLAIGSRIPDSLGKAIVGGCIAHGQLIPLLSGESLPIEEVVKRVNSGLDLWAYSYDTSSKQIIPNKIQKGFVQGIKSILKMTLDNGEEIFATADHKFLCRNGKWKQLQNLKPGDALLPLNRSISKSGYEIIVDPNTNLKEPTHWMVDRWKNGPRNTSVHAVHHKNFKKLDNTPANLCKVTHSNHFNYHASIAGNVYSRMKTVDPERYSKFVKFQSEKTTEWFKQLKSNPEKFQKYVSKQVNTANKKYKNNKAFQERMSKQSLDFWNSLENAEKQQLISNLHQGFNEYYSQNKEDFIKQSIKNLDSEKVKTWRISERNLDHLEIARSEYFNSENFENNKKLQSGRSKNFWENSTVEERANQGKICSSAISNYWANITPEEKSRKISSTWRTKIIKYFYETEIEISENSTGKYKVSIILKYFKNLEELKECVNNYNHKIVSIEEMSPCLTYDLSMENRRVPNFLVGSIFAHNCLDELNFGIINNQMQENFNSLIRRMQSRFMDEGGRMPGRLWIVSSEDEEQSAMNQIVDNYKNDPGLLVVQESLWTVKSHAYSDFPEKSFWVFKGSDTRAPIIISETDDLLATNPESCIQVPDRHRSAFESDLEKALRDLAGYATGSSYGLFKSKEKLFFASTISPLFPDSFSLSFYDNADQIQNHSLMPQYFYSKSVNKSIPRYIHLDIGISGDRFGMACSYVKGFNKTKIYDHVSMEEREEEIPVVYTEWAFGIESNSGEEIPIYKAESFIYWLAEQEFNIALVSADGYQSKQILQNLRVQRFQTLELSLDRNIEPYLDFRNFIYRGCSFLPTNAILKKELENLLVLKKDGVRNGWKVDHPEKNPDSSKGSKDLADSVAGSQTLARNNALKDKASFLSESETPSVDADIVQMFWKDKF